MKKILVIVIIVIGVVSVGSIFLKNRSNDKVEKKEIVVNQNEEKYVNKEQDGTKVNTSNKLKEVKKLGNLEISNISLVSKGNESYITAVVKNIGNVKDGDKAITIKVLSESGAVLATVNAYVDTLEAGARTTLRCTTSADFANAYDFIVSEY